MAMTVELATEILQTAGIDISEAELEGDRVLIDCPFGELHHPVSGGHNCCLIFNHTDSDEERDDPCEYSYYCYSCKALGPLWRIPAAYYGETYSKKWKRLLTLANKANERKFSETLKRKHRRVAKEGIEQSLHREARVTASQLSRMFDSPLAHEKAIEYLKFRRVPASTCSQYNLLFDEFNRRIVLPVCDARGGVITAVGRSVDRGDKRYYNYFEAPTENAVGGIHLFRRGLHKSAVIFEGPFDLLRQAELCLKNAVLPVCIFKSSVSAAQFSELAKLDVPLRPAFDGDSAGREGITKLCRKAAKQGVTCRPIWLPEGQDPGSLEGSRFNELLNQERKPRVRRTKKTPARGKETPPESRLRERLKAKQSQFSSGQR